MQFASKHSSLKDLLYKSKLVIVDSNHTVMLQSLVLNIPTILFWNPKLNKLNSDSIPYYDELMKVGILHICPQNAAQMVTMISSNPSNWWNNQNVQKARKNFCDKYATTNVKWLNTWVYTILEESKR